MPESAPRPAYSVITWSGGFPASAAIEIGKAADPHARDRASGTAVAGSPSARRALDRAPVTEHQQDSLLRGNLAEALAQRVAGAQHVGVVVEEEHPDDLDAVVALLQLRQDHLAELVARRVPGGGENVGDFMSGEH